MSEAQHLDKKPLKSTPERIFLSPPHMGGDEMRYVQEAFESNYIAPLGPQVDAFEKEFCDYTGFKHCVALNSGTSAMHLALRYLLRRLWVVSNRIWDNDKSEGSKQQIESSRTSNPLNASRINHQSTSQSPFTYNLLLNFRDSI